MTLATRHIIAIILFLLCGAAMVSCEGDGSNNLPNLAQVKSNQDMVPPADLPPPRAMITIDRVDLPLRRSLESAWAMVDEDIAPPLMMGMWQANGLRIGLLKVDQIPGFIEALPGAYAHRRSLIVATDHPTPLRRSPRLIGDVYVDLTVPPQTPRETRMSGGRMQLQSRMTRDGQEQLLIELVPHHFVPRAALLPRDPLDKELDGRFFDELAIRVEVPEDRVLVLGLYWPWPGANAGQAPSADEPRDTGTGHPDVGQMIKTVEEDVPANDEEEPTGPGSTEEEEDGPQPEPDAAAPVSADQPPPLRNHLGRAIMTALRQRKPIQVLLLVSVDPVASEQTPIADGDPLPDQ